MKNFFHGGFMLSKPLELFVMIQLQRLEQSVISLLHLRQKAPLVQEFQCPPVLNEPLELFVMIQLQRLDCSVASLLPTRQKAPLRQKLHPPHNLSEPLALFFCKNKQETT
ncbi:MULTISPECIES: hypothetical protein [Bacillus]|uniref:hypothetical protein n=1 Tax=Bacillus TaxID=1386 RepID=UPI00164253F8|nr:hypothetical protein [Bacillus mycoides]HDR7616021.1 hypothetical protein [Bacillus mycoides]